VLNTTELIHDSRSIYESMNNEKKKKETEMMKKKNK